jgi:hypothetical protein
MRQPTAGNADCRHVVESEAAIYCCTPCAVGAQAKGIEQASRSG